MRWSGFADLVFAESAWLAFARAAELAETDVHEQHNGAWVIDDRHIGFALETESSRSVVEAMKRFLGLLALQAEAGEATIEIVEPREHWMRRAASPSTTQGLAGSSESPPESRTIRAAVASPEGTPTLSTLSPAHPQAAPNSGLLRGPSGQATG